jgi:hypothetical protein
MKRHYYIGDDLAHLEGIERELESAGISKPQIHVLSHNDAEVTHRNLNEVEPLLRKDVVHSTEQGAIVGAVGACGVLLLWWLSGLSESYSWIPAIFLAVVVLGFCTWEGGLIGIQRPHMDFQRFQGELKRGRHILLVDVPAAQEDTLRRVVTEQQGLWDVGEGEATPAWVIDAQRKWSRFMEVAP